MGSKTAFLPGFVVVAGTLMVACSNGSAPDAQAADASPAPTQDGSPGIDAGASDAGTSGDSASSSDSAAPTGTQLQAGSRLTLWGVTRDGFAVDNDAASFYAAPLGGGAAAAIAPVPSAAYIGAAVEGNVALLWTNINVNTYVASLTVWSSAGGKHELSNASAFHVSVSADSQYVAYLDHIDPSGQTGDLYVAKADGTGVTLLVPALAGIQSACVPELTFGGSMLVASHCSRTDAGALGATLSTFSIPSWKRTDVISGVSNQFNLDQAATQALVTSSAGLQVVPLASGQATTIDPLGVGGLFTSDGKSVLYATSTFALERSTVASPSPVTLAPSGVAGIDDLSTDQASLLVYRNYDPQTGLSDLSLAPALKPGSLTTLSSAETAEVAPTMGQASGAGFTGDSSHAVFLTNVSSGSYLAPSVGTLNVIALAAGGSPRIVGQNAPSTVWTWGSSKIVYADNSTTVANGQTTVDIEWIDTAASSGPTRVVSQATMGSPYVPAPFYLSPSQDAVVYTTAEGLYEVPLQ